MTEHPDSDPVQARVKTLRHYLAEAEKHPEDDNLLYIEDLSIDLLAPPKRNKR